MRRLDACIFTAAFGLLVILATMVMYPLYTSSPTTITQVSTADKLASQPIIAKQKLYYELFHDVQASTPIDHYRFERDAVYFYENCSDPFNTWCEHLIENVIPEQVEPLSKDFIKITQNDEVRIFNGQFDVTNRIAAPHNFIALERFDTDPWYFTDGVYIYYLGRWNVGETPDTYTVGNRGEVDFPVKLSLDDRIEVPEKFSTPYHELPGKNSHFATRVLFLNNDVYLNGVLLPIADAATFDLIAEDARDSQGHPWFEDKGYVYTKTGGNLYRKQGVVSDPVTLWRIATSYGEEFLSEPNDFYLRDSYQILSKHELYDFGYRFSNTKQSNLDPDIFYAVASKRGAHYFVRIDLAENIVTQLTTLASNVSEYPPGVALASDDSAARFLFSSCVECGGDIVDEAVYRLEGIRGSYEAIGPTAQFEWLDDGYRYKPALAECMPALSRNSQACLQALETVEWMTRDF